MAHDSFVDTPPSAGYQIGPVSAPLLCSTATVECRDFSTIVFRCSGDSTTPVVFWPTTSCRSVRYPFPSLPVTP